MRRAGMWIAVVALTLLGGCAQGPASRDAALASGPRPAVARSGGFDCGTTDLGVATVSRCRPGGFDLLSAAGE